MCGAWVSRVVELVHTELDDRPAPISAATNLYKRTESAGSMRLNEKGCAAIAACDVSALAGSLEVYAWLCIYARVGNALISACAVNQPGYGGFIWTRSDGLTWLRLDNG